RPRRRSARARSAPRPTHLRASPPRRPPRRAVKRPRRPARATPTASSTTAADRPVVPAVVRRRPRGLPAAKERCPLFEEGGDPFAGVVGAGGDRLRGRLVFEGGGEVQPGSAAEARLGER